MEDEAGAGADGVVAGGVVAAGGGGQFCHMEIKQAVCTLSVVSSSILKLWFRLPLQSGIVSSNLGCAEHW